MYLYYFNRFSVLFTATLTSDADIVSILFHNVLFKIDQGSNVHSDAELARECNQGFET